MANLEAVEGLKYIADSPTSEYGGFHPNTVAIAKKSLLALLELKKECEALKARVVWLKDANNAWQSGEKELQQQLSALQKENATLTEQLGKAVSALSKIANNINANLLCDCQGENDEGSLIHEDNCEYRQLKQAVLDLKSIEAGRGK